MNEADAITNSEHRPMHCRAPHLLDPDLVTYTPAHHAHLQHNMFRVRPQASPRAPAPLPLGLQDPPMSPANRPLMDSTLTSFLKNVWRLRCTPYGRYVPHLGWQSHPLARRPGKIRFGRSIQSSAAGSPLGVLNWTASSPSLNYLRPWTRHRRSFLKNVWCLIAYPDSMVPA